MVWVNGPYKPRWYTDLIIFNFFLKKHLGRDEKVIADNKCIYRDYKCATKQLSTGDEGPVGKRILCVHEFLNSHLKQFAVLRASFTHDLFQHSDCFWAALNITQVFHKQEPNCF